MTDWITVNAIISCDTLEITAELVRQNRGHFDVLPVAGRRRRRFIVAVSQAQLLADGLLERVGHVSRDGGAGLSERRARARRQNKRSDWLGTGASTERRVTL